jgi:hypothetical protein
MRNPIEHLRERGRGVVRDDDDPDAIARVHHALLGHRATILTEAPARRIATASHAQHGATFR